MVTIWMKFRRREAEVTITEKTAEKAIREAIKIADAWRRAPFTTTITEEKS